jgi:hypothetical protein
MTEPLRKRYRVTLEFEATVQDIEVCADWSPELRWHVGLEKRLQAAILEEPDLADMILRQFILGAIAETSLETGPIWSAAPAMPEKDVETIIVPALAKLSPEDSVFLKAAEDDHLFWEATESVWESFKTRLVGVEIVEV